MSGKGDKPRHNLAKYGEGWERIFGTGDSVLNGSGAGSLEPGDPGSNPGHPCHPSFGGDRKSTAESRQDGGSIPPTSREQYEQEIRDWWKTFKQVRELYGWYHKPRPSWGARRKQAMKDRHA